MSEPRLSIAERKARVLARLPIASVVERHVKLSGGAGHAQRRGPCPFCSGKSSSFSIKHEAKGGFAHCFRCSFHGDAIRFLQDIRGLSFIDALVELEADAGFADAGATRSGSGPVSRDKNPTKVTRPTRELVTTLEMARTIWRMARPDAAAVRRYFIGRGVPLAVLTDARMAAFRFTGTCPLMQWDAGKKPDSVLIAPAIVALVRGLRRPPAAEGSGSADVRPAGSMPTAGRFHDGEPLEWIPLGLHVTFLNPGGDGTMVRRKPWAKADDDEPMFPKRKMLGPVGGGCVLLGEYHAGAPLFVGEGNETVLSALALAEAPDDAVGVATLSLDNLQGSPRKWRNGALPLHAIEPDRLPFLIPGHRGPVTGLLDSDMSPLKNQLVVERKGALPVRRAITGAERARICGELLVKGWRAAGAAPVTALRAPAGMDFNDAVRAEKEAA